MKDTEILEKNITESFKDMSDFGVRRFSVGGRRFALFYIKNLSSRDMINKYLISPLIEFGEGCAVPDAVTHVALSDIVGKDDAEAAILSGSCVIISDAEGRAYSAMTKNEEGRATSEPETENVIRGAHEGFTENGGANAMFIRRRIKSTHLKKEDFSVGGKTKTEVSIMYLDDVVRRDVVESLRRRISEIKINGIIDSGYVEMFIQDGKFSVFPTVGNSERPDKVAAKILEGRVAVIVDGSPVVLTVPYLFAEGFQVAEDYSKSPFFATFERFLRFFGMMASLLLPAVFLAAASIPSLEGSVFAEYVNSSRENIKMPLMAELVLVFIMFELVREVGLRMPKAVGSAVGIVGSLIIGDSAVEAGIISVPVLMVVAFSAVCNFLAPPYMNSNVVLRAFLILASGFFGAAGLFFSLVVVVAMLIGKKSFGTPYLSPLIPFSAWGQADFILMLPVWMQKYVPIVLSGRRILRSKGRKR